jgi:hypothetical protein
MKVIGGFSAPPNGFWSGEMRSRQKQKTPRNSLSVTDINTDIETGSTLLTFQQVMDLRWISGAGHPFFKGHPGGPMKLTRKFAVMTPDKRPQDPHMDGTGVRFETMEHSGEYPDSMPQAIKLIDAEGRSCVYVPITQDGRVVDSQKFMLDAEDE